MKADHEVELEASAYDQLVGNQIAVLMLYLFGADGEVEAGQTVRIVSPDGRAAIAQIQAPAVVVEILQRVNPPQPPPV